MASTNIPVPAHPASGIPAAIKEMTQKYLEITREYCRISDELTRIREAKKTAEQRLIQGITQNGLTGYGITYQGNKISLALDTTYDTLTYKFLEECLTELYGGDADKAKRVILFIKKQRTPHRGPSIKISGSIGLRGSRTRPETPPMDRE